MGVFMLVFTGPDKALLDRAARMFDAKAASLKWEEIQDPKKRRAAKEEFDRHKRDAFDLRALGVRLKKVAKVVDQNLHPLARGSVEDAVHSSPPSGG